MMLADLGADVIKIENPALGDYLRFHETRHLHLQTNKGKRSLALDLKQRAGQEIFFRLLSTADAIVTNALADRNNRLGIGYDQVKKHKPDIVYCQNTGFGATGPYRELPAHGHMMDALAGAMPMKLNADGLVGPDDKYKRRTGSLQTAGEATSMGALYAAFHVAAALAQREKTGEGCYIDVSSSHAVLASAWIAAATQINRPERRGWWQNEENLRPVARYQAYITRDDKFLLFCPEENKFWYKFCDLVGRPDLKDQERGESLRREVQSILVQRDRDDWMALALKHNLPIGPIHDGIDEVMADPQFQARPMFVDSEIGEQSFTYVCQPAIVDGVMANRPTTAPELGQHNNELLCELGYSSEQIQTLIDEQIIKAPQQENHITSAIYGDTI